MRRRVACLAVFIVCSWWGPARAQSGARLVALDEYGGCVVSGEGSVRCFGGLGEGEASFRSILAVPPDVVEIEAGERLSCLRTARGELHCFGRIYRDRAGDALGHRELRCPSGSAGQRCVAAIEAERDRLGRSATRVATGARDFAIHGSLVCSVNARSGALRCDAIDRDDRELEALDDLRWTPARLGRAEAVCSARDAVCALTDRDEIVCVGAATAAPVVAAQIPGASALACGGTRLCAVAASGALACGALDSSGRVTLAEVPGVSEVVDVAVADAHLCARRRDGAVLCAGENARGALGTGDLRARAAPIAVARFAGATALSVGRDATCAIVGGELRCAGDARFGRFGVAPTPEPRRFEALREPDGRPVRASAIAFGPSGVPCIRAREGAWRCAALDTVAPRVVMAPAFEGAADVVDVGAGCLLRASGRLECAEATLEGVARFDADTPGTTIALARDGGVFVYYRRPRAFVPSLGFRGLAVADVLATHDVPCVRTTEGEVRCEGGGTSFVPAAFRELRATAIAGAGGTLCARGATGSFRCVAAGGTSRYAADSEERGAPDAVAFESTSALACSLDARGLLTCEDANARFTQPGVASFRVASATVCAHLRDGGVACSSPGPGLARTGDATDFLFTPPRTIALPAE